MKRKVLILEDDAQQRRDLKALLEEHFKVEIEAKSSELEFREDWEQIVANPPDLAVLDVMVKWTNPSRTRKAEDLAADATRPETAGIRCAKKLRERFGFNAVKIILYSVLPKEDFEKEPVPDGVETVVKELDFDNLLEKIRELIPDIGPA